MRRLPLLSLIVICLSSVLPTFGLIEIRLATENAVTANKTQFLIENLGTQEQDIRGGPILAPVASESIRGVEGDILITWTASSSKSEQDPLSWKFESGSADIDSRRSGWGVVSEGDDKGFLQLEAGEALLVEFDLSKTIVHEGFKLFFKLFLRDGVKESYRVYEKVTDSEAKVVDEFVDREGTSKFGNEIPLMGKKPSFAITDAGFELGKRMRLQGLIIDTVPVE